MMQMSAILPNFAGFTIARGCFHLRLVDKIGSGAYGVVYLAQDLAPGPRGAPFYAVKCLLRQPDGSELARQQQRELAHHRALSDVPGVVSVHAVIEEEFYTFIVLDYCAGGDLFAAIMERATYVNNTPAVKRTLLQIVDALAACHERGIYHRDLKPENVLCSADDAQVYLADFGLSTRNERSTNFGCGSSFYMSPECLGIYSKKTPYRTAPCDVWALGTIFCNLITGRNPWYIASPEADQGFRLYLREGPAWFHKNLPMSVGAAEILGRIFEINPKRRITLPELRKAIEELDTFYPQAAPSTAAVAPSQPIVAELSVQVAADSVNMPSHARSQSAAAASPVSERPSDKPAGDELRPLTLSLPSPLSENFLSLSLSAAATATFVNTDTTASHFSETLDEVWPPSASAGAASSVITGTPEATSDSGEESGEESPGPVTPETLAQETSESPVVPELRLDADSPMAASASLPQVDLNVALEAVKGEEMSRKRRGSLSRIMDGMKRIRKRTLV
ncbi:kinase-like protein [Dichomitus squalens]|uniref:Kinase-like protein n=1 Tax=Dichomitus squalens TaxID=114155 RepID=A0A4Q9PVP1_9APHY|nr:kinase-like protein [Dichomitus squalens]